MYRQLSEYTINIELAFWSEIKELSHYVHMCKYEHGHTKFTYYCTLKSNDMDDSVKLMTSFIKRYKEGTVIDATIIPEYKC